MQSHQKPEKMEVELKNIAKDQSSITLLKLASDEKSHTGYPLLNRVYYSKKLSIWLWYHPGKINNITTNINSRYLSDSVAECEQGNGKSKKCRKIENRIPGAKVRTNGDFAFLTQENGEPSIMENADDFFKFYNVKDIQAPQIDEFREARTLPEQIDAKAVKACQAVRSKDRSVCKPSGRKRKYSETESKESEASEISPLLQFSSFKRQRIDTSNKNLFIDQIRNGRWKFDKEVGYMLVYKTQDMAIEMQSVLEYGASANANLQLIFKPYGNALLVSMKKLTDVSTIGLINGSVKAKKLLDEYVANQKKLFVPGMAPR